MRDVMWAPIPGPGLEHLHLAADRCASVLIATDAGHPYSFSYHLTWDAGWHVRTVDARLLGEERAPIQLRTDGTGHWLTAQGEDMAALAGCIDVDFTASPFTNTLPIRRLGLQVGQSARLLVVYILVPTLEIRPATQTYTRLDATHYRYESGTFRADLPVDEDGLVLDYPGLWRRIPATLRA
ncbi:MAG: hypothetical protein E6J01_01920 [Chloroflexi bacterium]|nr:MAG: hypothetical protein E6J01_01920 [Chloroflexota bacterium]